MNTVRDILHAKGGDVCTVSAEVTVFDTLKVMAERNIGAVLVVDAGRPIGMFSERDYARQVILKGKASKDTPVHEVMSTHVVFVRPSQKLEECMALMTDKRVRHLPVLEDDRVIGIVSIGDVVKAMISEKEFIIEQLATYISSGG